MFLNDWYEQYKKVSAEFRAKNFLPILKLMAKLKITPNQITTFRILFLLPVVYYFYYGNFFAAIIFYCLFWFFDLFDGALARYLNMSSDKGRFLDTIVDNFAYGILLIGFIYWQSAWVWLLAANILLEYFAQLLAIIKKQGKAPSDFIIKAQADLPYFKSVAHTVLLLYCLGFNILNFTFSLLNLALLAIIIHYYFYIKNKL